MVTERHAAEPASAECVCTTNQESPFAALLRGPVQFQTEAKVVSPMLRLSDQSKSCPRFGLVISSSSSVAKGLNPAKVSPNDVPLEAATASGRPRKSWPRSRSLAEVQYPPEAIASQ